MLRPIPAKIMRSSALVRVCSGVDRYQNQTYTDYAVNRVHLQPTNEVRKTVNNADMVLRSVLFVDARISSPLLDWPGLFRAAQANKGDMRVIVRGETYTVVSVDELRDDTDQLHHWEISLV